MFRSQALPAQGFHHEELSVPTLDDHVCVVAGSAG
jgi:hypothetical protein